MLARGPRSDHLGSPHRDEIALDVIIDVTRAVWRRIGWVIAAVVLSLMVAVAWLGVTKPLYSSSVHILLDPIGKRLLNADVVRGGLGYSPAGSDLLLVESQVDIVSSDIVLAVAVRATGLADDPEFAKISSPGLSSRFLGMLIPGQRDRPAAIRQSAEAAAVEGLRKNLTVKRAGNSYVLEIAVRSESPEMAARLADAVAAAYLDEERENVRLSTRQSTEVLLARVDVVRERLRAVEQQAETHRVTHGIADNEDGLMSELYAFQGKIEEASAIAAARRGEYEAAASTARNDPLDRDLANAAATARVLSELAAIDVEAASADLAAFNLRIGPRVEALVSMRELDREVAAIRSVFEDILRRARETSEQEHIWPNNVRILSPASIPTRHVYPPVQLVLLAALVLGALIGSMIAWIRELASRRQGPTFATLDSTFHLDPVTRGAVINRIGLPRSRADASEAN